MKLGLVAICTRTLFILLAGKTPSEVQRNLEMKGGRVAVGRKRLTLDAGVHLRHPASVKRKNN
ncbi:MAG: hypothetical protein ICV63_18145 [Coleofasciculus sp. Co-bin14]|nr:hypothetical protein [Coleofasciculus sp. Co-bin14]